MLHIIKFRAILYRSNRGRTFMSVSCVKSKQRFLYSNILYSADSHISPRNLRRHALIIRASLFLFCQRGQPRHVRKVASRECPYYSRRRRVHAHTSSLFFSTLTPSLSRSFLFFSNFSPIDATRCDLSPRRRTQLRRLSRDFRSVRCCHPVYIFVSVKL